MPFQARLQLGRSVDFMLHFNALTTLCLQSAILFLPQQTTACLDDLSPLADRKNQTIEMIYDTRLHSSSETKFHSHTMEQLDQILQK